MSAMILMFSLRAIDVAELIDNYLSYIQDVYFQIVNQNTQIIRANQNVINDNEMIAVNKQIIKAQMKVKVILFDSLLQTRSLQNIGILYGLAIVLSSLFVKD